MTPFGEIHLDSFEQLDDGSCKWLSQCSAGDLDSIAAWHRRRYARGLVTRRKVRNGLLDALECDFLMPDGRFCDRPATAYQIAGPAGEPYALCSWHPGLVTDDADAWAAEHEADLEAMVRTLRARR
jgi:hypothetical protein